jgi:hypothetical protein
MASNTKLFLRIIIGAFICFSTFVLPKNVNCQQLIYIGKDAKEVKSLVERIVKDHNQPDIHGRRKHSSVFYDVIYQDGIIKNVILCYIDQHLLEFNKNATYCKIYNMKENELSKILYQYDNISTNELIRYYDYNNQFKKINNNYYTDDFSHFYKIYLAENGKATVEFNKINHDNLTPHVKLKIREYLQNEKDSIDNLKKVFEAKRKMK